MRFPPSPQFLMNAAAMGAEAVEVAFERGHLIEHEALVLHGATKGHGFPL